MGAIRKHQRRPPFLILGLAHRLRRPKPLPRLGRIPDQQLILGNQNIRMAIPIQVNEPQVGVVPIHIGDGLKGLEIAPFSIGFPLVVARQRAQQHNVLGAISG